MGSRVDLFEEIRRDRRTQALSIRELAERAGVCGHVMLPCLGPVHSQYTRRPLTALNHRCPQRRCLSNTNGLHDYQRPPETQTMTS